MTFIIALWRFGSPPGLQFPKWKFPWECEGSFLHSQASLLARNLANPHFGHEPKAKVATWILCCPEVGWVSEIWGVRFLVVHPRTSLPIEIYIYHSIKMFKKWKKKNSKLKDCLVFTKVFNFFSWIPISTQALFHSYFPFPDLLSQVMHFCKSIKVDLMETYFRFLKIFCYILQYWHAFENTCPKQVP
jgi:hypothetical protein